MSEPDRLRTLSEIEAAIWQELQRATHDRHHEWRMATLASVALDGSADARTVVLREAQPQARRLIVYSDERAAKVAQLRKEPRATVVCWSRRLGWQLRVRTECRSIEDDAALAARWHSVAATSRAADYLSLAAPGSMLSVGTQRTGEEPHFAVIEAEVVSFDWLELHRAGHRRATFNAAGGRWLQP